MTLRAVWSGRKSGPVIVLVHGLGGSHRAWAPVAALLAERFTVVAVDLPGGRAIEREADDLRHTLTRAKVANATIAGHSMGGLVATALAERAPRLVERLVLVNAPPSLESRLAARGPTERILRLPVIGPLVWSLLGPDQLRAALRTAVAPGAEVPEQLIADLRATSHAAFTGSSIAIDRYLAARPLPERLAALGIPIDVVFGLQDQRVDPASLTAYDALHNVQVTPIQRSGHYPPWESPAAVSTAIHAQKEHHVRHLH
jgi:pimeloyl-ACP methyl ester carboxylesterase